MNLQKILPERAERVPVRLRRFGLYYIGVILGFVALAGLAGYAHMLALKKEMMTYGAPVMIVFLLWLWLRPIASCIVYSVWRGYPVRGLLGDITWRYHASFGVVAGFVAYRVLDWYHVFSRIPSVHHFIQANHLDPRQEIFGLMIAGFLMAMAARAALFAHTTEDGSQKFSESRCVKRPPVPNIPTDLVTIYRRPDAPEPQRPPSAAAAVAQPVEHHDGTDGEQHRGQHL